MHFCTSKNSKCLCMIDVILNSFRKYSIERNIASYDWGMYVSENFKIFRNVEYVNNEYIDWIWISIWEIFGGGKSCMNRTNVSKWVDWFKSCRISDEPQSEHPVKVGMKDLFLIPHYSWMLKHKVKPAISSKAQIFDKSSHFTARQRPSF